jgi:hypothetical protein
MKYAVETGSAAMTYIPSFIKISSVAIYEPLPSNRHSVVAYFAVVAYQRVYMPQYYQEVH